MIGGTALTDEQQMLLRTLVHHASRQRLSETITPFPTGEPDEYAIHVQGAPSLLIRGLYDLDALCKAGVLSMRWDRMGFSKLYRLIPASYAAVERDFEGVYLPAPNEGIFDLRTIFFAMSGGELLPESLEQLLPFAPAQMTRIERDTWIDRLVEALLVSVRRELARPQRIAYDATARALTEQLKTRFGNPETIRSLLADLALVGRIQAAPALARRIWPLLYPLMLLAGSHLDPPEP